MKDIAVLLTGSLVGQLIPFLVLPYLQRYFYTPADFGLLTVFVTFSELFANVATFKLEYGIVVQRRIRDAVNLAYAAFRMMSLMLVFSLVVVLLFRHSVADYLGHPHLANYFFLLPLYIFFAGSSEIFSYWNNRKRRFKTISTSKIVQSGASEGFKVAGGFIGFNFAGLLVGRIFGFFAMFLYYLARFLRTDRRALQLINKKDSNAVLKKNVKYIYFTTPSVFLGTLVNLVYVQLFLYHFGDDIVGMIGVSMTYLSAGFGVIGISFSQVFYTRLAEIRTKAEMYSVYVRFAKNLFALALVPVVFVYLLPDQWVINILGSDWVELMPIARIMVLWLAIWFVSSSLSFIYMRLQMQAVMTIFDLVHLAVIFIGFYAGYGLSPTLEGALWGFTIAQGVFYAFVIAITLYFIRTTDESKL